MAKGGDRVLDIVESLSCQLLVGRHGCDPHVKPNGSRHQSTNPIIYEFSIPRKKILSKGKGERLSV